MSLKGQEGAEGASFATQCHAELYDSQADTAENISALEALEVSEGHFGIRVAVLIHKEGQTRQLGENRLLNPGTVAYRAIANFSNWVLCTNWL